MSDKDLDEGTVRRGRPVAKGWFIKEYEQEIMIANEPYTWYPQREGRPDLVLKRLTRRARLTILSSVKKLHASIRWSKPMNSRACVRLTSNERAVSK